MGFEKNQKRVLRGWAMYDWANSVFSLTITTAIFPGFYLAVTQTENGLVRIFGVRLENSVVYDWTLALSFLLIAGLSPLLSGIADASGRKLGFMKVFCYVGSLSCMGLFFFESLPLELGLLLFVIGSMGFAGSIVFYNAFLPEIATPDRFDRVSAMGFGYGYVGSVLLLILNLAVIITPATFGLSDEPGSLPARLAFLTVGLWWMGFAQIAFARLPTNVYGRQGRGSWKTGYQELRKVWRELTDQKDLKRYLSAFFFFNMGVQTIMYLAVGFGTVELRMPQEGMIVTILIIQLVAIGGAWLMARLSGRFGNLAVLATTVGLWVLVCIGAFLSRPETLDFYYLAAFVGIVMGGIQSLARSTYAKLLPETEDHASYFSFYDVSDKLGTALGTLSYGLVETLSGGMRGSTMTLGLYFVIGFVLLLRVRRSALHHA